MDSLASLKELADAKEEFKRSFELQNPIRTLYLKNK
jgi:hypothetical protein